MLEIRFRSLATQNVAWMADVYPSEIHEKTYRLVTTGLDKKVKMDRQNENLALLNHQTSNRYER